VGARPTARPAVLVASALVALVAVAAPAAADPPRPTDYRSTVTGIVPEVDGVRAEIVGGDAFLELTVDEGIEVVVPGYGDDAAPYLRFLPDGTVERNTRSPATYVNEDRQGAVDVPPQADDEAEPEWEEVASGGAYAWHDHRVHWMSPRRPPGVEPGEVVQDWTVPIMVDGTPAEVRGELVLAAGVSPVPWFALVAAGAAVVVVLGRRRPGVAPVAVLVAAAAALVPGWAQFSVAPAGSGADPLLVAVPVVGLLAAGVGVAFRRRPLGPTATLAGAAAVVGWAVLRASVLWKPVLPTDLPAGLDRGLTALALGLAVAGAGLVVWSGALAVGRIPAGSGEPVVPTDEGPGADDAAATRGGGEPR
jgi:hypothetical protein